MTQETITIAVSDDGSLTIPAEVLQTLGIPPHQYVLVETQEKELVLRLSPQASLERIDQLLQDALADVEWDEIEAKREDRWF